MKNISERKSMERYVNKATHINLVDIELKLNTHIQLQNNEGWELFSVVQQMVGINESLVMFWKKPIPEGHTGGR